MNVVDAIDQPRDPTDAAFREADLQARESHGHLGVEPVDRGEHGVAEEENSDGDRWRVGRGCRGRTRRTHVQADHSAGFFARGEEGVPVTGMERRQAHEVRRLGERHRFESACRIAADLIAGTGGIA